MKFKADDRVVHATRPGKVGTVLHVNPNPDNEYPYVVIWGNNIYCDSYQERELDFAPDAPLLTEEETEQESQSTLLTVNEKEVKLVKKTFTITLDESQARELVKYFADKGFYYSSSSSTPNKSAVVLELLTQLPGELS